APGLADACPVDPEVSPVEAGDRVGEHTFGGAGHRMHADEERRVAAGFEERRVAGPLGLDDELAGRVEVFGDQRVEGETLAGAVTIEYDDLGRAGGLRASDRGVDLLGI